MQVIGLQQSRETAENKIEKAIVNKKTVEFAVAEIDKIAENERRNLFIRKLKELEMSKIELQKEINILNNRLNDCYIKQGLLGVTKSCFCYPKKIKLENNITKIDIRLTK